MWINYISTRMNSQFTKVHLHTRDTYGTATVTEARDLLWWKKAKAKQSRANRGKANEKPMGIGMWYIGLSPL